MATFHFELVSPDRISFSGEVDQVDVPGAEGDFGVLACLQANANRIRRVCRDFLRSQGQL